MEKRTLCLVEGQSLWEYPIKRYRSKLDYRKLMELLKRDSPNLTQPIAYMVGNPSKDQLNFFMMIRKIGYDLKVKMLYHKDGIIQNTSWTDEMEQEARNRMDDYDRLALVTANTKLLPLAEQLMDEFKKEVYVYCWPQEYETLASASTKHQYLDRSMTIDKY